ncbi:signal peptidase I [Eubacterium xylanophilum]|uniref:signal peptidase I n=1 Tax=Eubacterium xylanophilum TaxID=39497 RepID=UPI0004BA92A9|nr:signal peptidase I [Eubacterium xylanophilum]
MDDNKILSSDIEDNLRFVESLLSDHPEFISDDSVFDKELDNSQKKVAGKVEPFPVLKESKASAPKAAPVPKPEPAPAPKVEPVKKPEPAPAPKAEPAPKPALAPTLVKPAEPQKIKPTKVEPVKEEPKKAESLKVSPVIENKPKSEDKPKSEVKPKKEKKAKEKKEKISYNERPGGIKKIIISIVVCAGLAFGIAFLLNTFVINHTMVSGTSMSPTLEDSDEILIEKVSYISGKPERFDVIVFNYKDDVKYIKRVIGLPGETVQIKSNKIYVNGRAIFDEFGKGKLSNAGIAKDELKLGPDQYFVLGDNRKESKDSRSEDVGLIKKDKIVGKAWLRVLPFKDFETIR